MVLPLAAITVAFVILLVLADHDRRQRRRNLGLPPLPRESDWQWPPAPAGHIRLGLERASHVNAPATLTRPGADQEE